MRLHTSIILGLIVLSGCVDLPKPFAHQGIKQNKSLTQLADARGVKVTPPTGVQKQVAENLSEKIAENLRRSNIPATTNLNLSQAYTLNGKSILIPPVVGTKRVIQWTLSNTQNTVVKKFSSRVDPRLPDSETSRLRNRQINGLAKEASLNVIAFFNGDPKKQLNNPDRALISVNRIRAPSFEISQILHHAMSKSLVDAGVASPTLGRPTQFNVAGNVDVSPVENGFRDIRIVWTLSDAKGKTIGKIRQGNAVLASTLDKSWNKMASDVAQSALNGILDLLSKIDISDDNISAPDQNVRQR